MKSVFIADALRTPSGSLQGNLAPLSSTELASIVAGTLWKQNRLIPEQIEQVIFGSVFCAGTGTDPARQATLKAGFPYSVPGLSVQNNRLSGISSIQMAVGRIDAGQLGIILAGGMESMSNAPLYTSRHRPGSSIGHSAMRDTLLTDDAEDPFVGTSWSQATDQICSEKGIKRDELDEGTMRLFHNSLQSLKNGAFEREIVPVTLRSGGKKAQVIRKDQPVGRVDPEKISRLHPLFGEDGTLTRAHCAPAADGAAALLLTDSECAARLRLSPLARVAGMAETAVRPADWLSASSQVITKAARDAEVELQDIQWFEIDEPFAVASLYATKELELDPQYVNRAGNSVSLGNATGTVGARILVTLVHALNRHQIKWGCAATVQPNGSAAAVVLERM